MNRLQIIESLSHTSESAKWLVRAKKSATPFENIVVVQLLKDIRAIESRLSDLVDALEVQP